MVTVQAAIEVDAIGQHARSGAVTLRDISLTVGQGELVAIIGGSGSGKTTLLDAMSGLRPPRSGTVRRLPRATGYVAAGETLPAVLPLARALRYRAALRGLSGRGDGVPEALRATGLTSAAADPVGVLDAGQRRRAAIAAELLAAPALLFLEEPAADLDPAQSTEVMRLLRRLCDAGTTVVLTTSSPLDAARCDKVAVLATGGHLAFFGTTTAACGYFGADSLDEIYERLAGLGDPAAAWSRRFFGFSRTSPGFPSDLTTGPAPWSAPLVPDSAGPYSAGRPTAVAIAEDLADPVAVGGIARSPRDGVTAVAGAAVVRPLRQSVLLTRRNVDVLARSRPALALLAAPPVAVLLAFAVLFGLGAFDQARPGPEFWVAAGGLLVGLAYGLPQVHQELDALRAERFPGLSGAAYVLSKAAVLLPVLALADAVILVPPAAAGRLPGYGPAFVTALLSSAVAVALGLLLSAAMPAAPRAFAPAAAGLPAVLLAAALLALLDQPVGGDWLALLALAVALLAATVVLITRRFPASAR